MIKNLWSEYSSEADHIQLTGPAKQENQGMTPHLHSTSLLGGEEIHQVPNVTHYLSPPYMVETQKRNFTNPNTKP